MPQQWRASVTVYPEDQAMLMKVTEVLSRAAMGLALEGVDVMLNIGPLEDDDEQAETPVAEG